MNTYLLCIKVVRHHHHTPKRFPHMSFLWGSDCESWIFFSIPLSVCAIGIRLSQSLDTFVSLIHSEKKKMWCLLLGQGGREYFEGDFLFCFVCFGFFCNLKDLLFVMFKTISNHSIIVLFNM